MPSRALLPALSLLALAACAEPGAISPPAAPSTESLCPGSTLTHIYASSITDIDDLASPVGAMIWDSTAGGSLAGDRVCTATLISPSVAITAGHCFDASDYVAKGHTLPAGVSTAEDICDLTGVQFNYQYMSRGTMPPAKGMPTYACEELLFQEHSTGYDYALIHLDGAPGDTYGWHELEVDGHATSDAITVVSHPSGGTKKVAQGSIIDTNGYAIEHTASTEGGSSGAALLDADGHILGIHTEGASGGTCTSTSGNYGWSNDWLRSDSLMGWLRENEYVDLSPLGEEEAGDQLGYALAVGDFDNDGADDLAMGAPYRDQGAMSDAGAVIVRYGYEGAGLDPTSDQELTQSKGSVPEAGDHCGEALAVGDFDDDGFDDLAVACPDENWGSTSNSGHVQIHYGSASGLGSAYEYFIPNSWGLSNQASGYFGAAMATGDFDDDGIDDLAVGAWGWDSSAGQVFIASSNGSDLYADLYFDQGDTGVDTAESGDAFGWSLAAGDFDNDGADDLAVGAPFESFDTYTAAGQVTVVYGDSPGLDYSSGQWLEMDWDTPTSWDAFGYTLAAGIQGGDGYAELAIAAPWWDYAPTSVPDLGLVEIHRGAWGGLSTTATYGISQNMIPSVDAYDKTGMALVWGTFDDVGEQALALGAPYDDEGSASSSGLVMVTSGEDWPSWGLDYTTADPEPLMERSASDKLGWALAAGDFDGTGEEELVMGIPGADAYGASGCGGVLVVEPW